MPPHLSWIKPQELGREVAQLLGGTSVFLIGMMGSGKSAVGKELCRVLGYTFFDSDDMVVELTGRAIADIFREQGEDTFRDLETQMLQELAPYKQCVVATGGGAVLRPINWGSLHAGVVVWLNGAPELLAKRVVRDGTSTRPLLAGSGEEEESIRATTARLQELGAQRRPLYEQADVVVPLDGGEEGAPLPAVVWRTLALLRKRLAADADERRRAAATAS